MLPVFVQMSPIKNNENLKNIGHFQFNLTKVQLQVMHMGQQQGWLMHN